MKNTFSVIQADSDFSYISRQATHLDETGSKNSVRNFTNPSGDVTARYQSDLANKKLLLEL